MKHKSFIRIEEIILIFLILLNVMEFFRLLNSDFSYIKEITSFVIIAYLFYKASLSKQFFGTKNKDFDFLIIFSMISMILVRNAIAASQTANKGFFSPFFTLLKINASLFESIGLYVGTSILFFLAIYSANKIRIKSPSILYLVHEKNLEPTIQKIFTNYLLFLVFFLFVFNLVAEWLTLAIDAPIISLALIGYLFLSFKKHYFDPESTLFKIGNFGNEFFQKFINNFKYKERLSLMISGMLILHLITDIGVFLIPAITGIKGNLYYSLFQQNHLSIMKLSTIVSSSLSERIIYLISYFLSTIGFFLLMISPAIIWYFKYFNKKIVFSKLFIATYYSTIFCFLLIPIYKILPLTNNFYGVDIQSIPVFSNPLLIIFLSSIFFIVAYFLFNKVKKLFSIGIIVISSGFFFWYVINYFLSSVNYYSNYTMLLFNKGYYYIAIHFFIFLMLIIIFYLVGYWMYLRSVIKEFTI